MSYDLIIFVLVQLGIVGAIGYGFVLWRRRSAETGPDLGIGTARRFYFYSISFVAVGMLAGGVTMVLMSLLDGFFGEPVLRTTTSRLAAGIALTIVGAPLWFFHWRFAERSTVTHPSERHSILRKLYIYVVSGVALGFLAFSGYRIIEWIARADEFSALPWASALVWAPVWVYHWRVASAESPESTLETLGIRRLYLYLASALGIAMLAAGLGNFGYFILEEGYSAAFGVTVIETSQTGLARDALRTSLSVAIVGGLIWWTHWMRFASADRESVLRWFYLFAAAVGGGAITALVGSGIAVSMVLVWVFGASTDPANAHFDDLPAALAVTAVGFAMWAYHRRRMTDEAVGRDAVHVFRSYDLLLTTIGLIALSVASAAILDTFLKLVSDTSSVVVAGDVQWRQRIAAILTILAIGIPVWWIHWRRIQLAAASDPDVERTALPRKIYVMGVLCLGLLALVGGASSTLFIFIRDLLDVDLSANTLRELSTSLAIVVTAVFIIPYHWTIYRQDRALEPDTPSPPVRPENKRVTLLTATGGSHLVTQVENALGYAVTTVGWSDPDAYVPDPDDEHIDTLAEQVASAPGANVLLIPVASGFRVMSYD